MQRLEGLVKFNVGASIFPRQRTRIRHPTFQQQEIARGIVALKHNGKVQRCKVPDPVLDRNGDAIGNCTRVGGARNRSYDADDVYKK